MNKKQIWTILENVSMESWYLAKVQETFPALAKYYLFLKN